MRNYQSGVEQVGNPGPRPGIGTSVLADRLRSLERAGVVAREPGPVGGGVVYALTDRGRALDAAVRELRRWGVGFLADPTADGSADQRFDVTNVGGIHTLPDGQFQLDIDGEPYTLGFAGGRLHQEPGIAPGPELTVRTTSAFLDRWAAGEVDWDGGRASGEVTTEGWNTPGPATCYASTRRPQMPDSPTGFFHEISAAALTHPDVATGTMLLGQYCLENLRSCRFSQAVKG